MRPLSSALMLSCAVLSASSCARIGPALANLSTMEPQDETRSTASAATTPTTGAAVELTTREEARALALAASGVLASLERRIALLERAAADEDPDVQRRVGAEIAALRSDAAEAATLTALLESADAAELVELRAALRAVLRDADATYARASLALVPAAAEARARAAERAGVRSATLESIHDRLSLIAQMIARVETELEALPDDRRLDVIQMLWTVREELSETADRARAAAGDADALRDLDDDIDQLAGRVVDLAGLVSAGKLELNGEVDDDAP